MAEAIPTNPANAGMVSGGTEESPDRLSQEEIERQDALFNPLREDRERWEKSMTDEEKDR